MSHFRSSQERPTDADTKQLIRLVTRFYGHLNNAVTEIRLDTDHTGESVYPHLDACRKCVQAMRQTSPEGEEIWDKMDSSLDSFEAMVAKGVKLHASRDLGGKRRAYAARTRELGVEAQLQLDAAMDLASDWLGVHLPQK